MIACPECGSDYLQKRGFNRNKNGEDTQRYMCMDCRTWFNEKDVVETADIRQARIAVIDVETLPAKAYVWGLYDQNISGSQIIQEGCLLSWGAKILNESKADGEIMSYQDAIKYNPAKITHGLWKYLSKIDIVIGHNYQDFDRRVINTAFLMAGLPPLKYKIIDTLKTARENFKFSSNKMADINRVLGIRNKISNEGFPLWAGCSNGDRESLDKMLEYNIGDLYATEELYYKVRPYIFNHPNLALYNTIENEQCPNCLSTDLKNEGYYPPIASGMYESVRCGNCGGLHRRKTNLLSNGKRKSLLSR